MDVIDDVIRVDQVMMPWWRTYVLVLTVIAYGIGIGGVIGAIVTGDVSNLLPLLVVPVFLRLFVVPLVRSRQRDAVTSFIACEVATAGTQIDRSSTTGS